jgi:hypothetical protein
MIVRHALARSGQALRHVLARSVSESLRRDLHQFRLLSRDAVRQLIDTALLSLDVDPMDFTLWMLALIATPPAFFAARQVLTYTALINAPLEVVHGVALAHRLFFVIYGMLAAALLAALTWEAVFPDGRDQEIVGVLPVRPRTFAAARLGAAMVVCLVFCAAVNVPAALLYTAFCAGHPAFGNIVTLLAGHVLATMMGSFLVFFTLLTARGVAAIILGARAGAWLGAGLQLISVVLMFEVFFFLPGVLGTLVRAITHADSSATSFPPVWFGALHAWVAGEGTPVLEQAMITGVMAFTAALVAVVPIYLVPAGWLGRRALEQRARERAAGTTALVKVVAWATSATPPVRGVFQFAVASLLRSHRHLLVLATYLGMAIAICLASILLIEVRGTFVLTAPAEWVLALPLVFMFFSVLGLRASFRIPTEFDANWPFRLAQPTLAACVNAAMLVMLTVAVLPIVAISSAVTALVWAFSDVAKTAALQLLAGWMLIEIVLFNWSKVPFACAHSPSPDVLKAWWPAYIMAMYLYAFRLSDWQFAALTSSRAMVWYLAAVTTVIAIVRLLRYQRLRQQAPEFDAISTDAVERLNLSEALN